jgi:hypothetical protein
MTNIEIEGPPPPLPDSVKSILQKLDIDKAKAEMCRRSFYYFVQQFWEIIINETPVWNWHIEYLCNELQEI